MAPEPVKNRRALKRYSVNLRVFNQETGAIVGYAKDLSISGMKLMSEEPIPEKTEIQIWFGASQDDKEEERIKLTAFSVWGSFTDTEPRHYYTGLHFSDPSEAALDRIQALIHSLNE